MLILLVERFRLYLKIEHQIEHSMEKNFFGWPILNSITNWPLYNFMTHISLSFTCTDADFDWRILNHLKIFNCKSTLKRQIKLFMGVSLFFVVLEQNGQGILKKF